MLQFGTFSPDVLAHSRVLSHKESHGKFKIFKYPTFTNKINTSVWGGNRFISVETIIKLNADTEASNYVTDKHDLVHWKQNLQNSLWYFTKQ